MEKEKRIDISKWNEIKHNFKEDPLIDKEYYEIKDYASRDDYTVILTENGKDKSILKNVRGTKLFNEKIII